MSLSAQQIIKVIYQKTPRISAKIVLKGSQSISSKLWSGSKWWKLHLASPGGDNPSKEKWWNKANAWMVQLNKHFHLKPCIITAKAIYSLALGYFIEFHKFHFRFLWRHILKEIYCSLDIIKACEIAMSCSLHIMLSLVFAKGCLIGEAPPHEVFLILQDMSGAMPENSAQKSKVLNSKVHLCCCWLQKAVKRRVSSVFWRKAVDEDSRF